ncbi:MAG: carbamoyltransferase HypF [Candidatus Heimdallarchaeota archaeon]
MTEGIEFMPTLFVYGIVQGVGFRPTVYNIAMRLGLKGYVRNNGSNVEIVLESEAERFLAELKRFLPALARIERIETKEETPGSPHNDFVILSSEEGSRASIIPTDTALCQECRHELFALEDRRYQFLFTNCTGCGARFSLIGDLPFDRQRTSMVAFPMCSSCLKEYQSATNRRFHAQTISCHNCGPKYVFYDKSGVKISDDPIRLFSERLTRGEVGIVKSWGGMHIIATFQAIPRLRRLYQRIAKPFAIMLKDQETVYRYCAPSRKEIELLTSPQKPIVILQKKKGQFDEELEFISPGLGNVGVMLPYAPLHYLLFEILPEDGVVATSANPPGEPMCIANTKAFNLGLDFYLLHNRDILQRCDDSVVRINGGRTFFIRKSRGFVPTPIAVPYDTAIAAVGAEMNVSAAISKEGRLFQTQYIGNTAKYATSLYLTEAIQHLRALLGIDQLAGIALDLHPRYATRRVAKELSETENVEMMEIQHHWAHAVSLALDNSIEEPIVALTIDGTGYGDDGMMWGGEVLLSSPESYSHVASLEPLPLIGGDKAILDPKRVVFAISELLKIENHFFPPDTSEIFRKVLQKSVRTTSLGRVLDAISCYLGIGTERTYDGEPAMKLEPLLEEGKGDFWIPERTNRDERVIIETLPSFRRLFEMNPQSARTKANLAYSMVSGIVREMALVASEFAENQGIKFVGVTGGVAYSRPIAEMIKSVVVERGLTLLLHKQIAPGDGGISAGQNYIMGASLSKK